MPNLISLIFRFLRDRSIPLKEKWWIIIPIIYILSPIDLIPAPILGFGFLDDIAVFLFTMAVAKDKMKKYYGVEPSEKVKVDKDKVVEDVEYEVIDDEEDK